METYFIRHTSSMDVDEATRKHLWEERKIAIHFPHSKEGGGLEDCRSIDPTDYSKSAAKCMRTFTTLAKAGGYVCAQYFPYEDCLVGIVPPNSEIQLYEGKWGKKWGCEGRTAILKTLPLTQVKVVKPKDHALILVGRPRQGAVVRWPSARFIIEDLVENRKREPAIANLSADQQEILCSEFLRLPAAGTLNLPILAHLLLPVGRTMKDIDIIGLSSDGKLIFSQVTYLPLKQAQWKLNRLALYKDSRNYLLLFCQADERIDVDGITVVPMDQVFEQFINTPLGKRWIHNAFNSL